MPCSPNWWPWSAWRTKPTASPAATRSKSMNSSGHKDLLKDRSFLFGEEDGPAACFFLAAPSRQKRARDQRNASFSNGNVCPEDTRKAAHAKAQRRPDEAGERFTAKAQRRRDTRQRGS